MKYQIKNDKLQVDILGLKLTSDKGKKSIHVNYPDMPYLGLWHWPKTDAPYICIEP